MQFKKYLKCFIILIIVLLYNEILITGTEVKRIDKDGLIDNKNLADGPTRDVYFIYIKNLNDTKVMPYNNEDTSLGFPFYFKFIQPIFKHKLKV